MKKLGILLISLLTLACSSCIGSGGDTPDTSNEAIKPPAQTAQTTAPDESTAAKPEDGSQPSLGVTDEYPNEPSDGYSKRY